MNLYHNCFHCAKRTCSTMCLNQSSTRFKDVSLFFLQEYFFSFEENVWSYFILSRILGSLFLEETGSETRGQWINFGCRFFRRLFVYSVTTNHKLEWHKMHELFIKEESWKAPLEIWESLVVSSCGTTLVAIPQIQLKKSNSCDSVQKQVSGGSGTNFLPLDIWLCNFSGCSALGVWVYY